MICFFITPGMLLVRLDLSGAHTVDRNLQTDSRTEACCSKVDMPTLNLPLHKQKQIYRDTRRCLYLFELVHI